MSLLSWTEHSIELYKTAVLLMSMSRGKERDGLARKCSLVHLPPGWCSCRAIALEMQQGRYKPALSMETGSDLSCRCHLYGLCYALQTAPLSDN